VPVPDGVKYTLIVQLPPGAIAFSQVLLCWNTPPPVEIPVIFSDVV
jgi:hypothetical protein